jgi:hypothetical protein
MSIRIRQLLTALLGPDPSAGLVSAGRVSCPYSRADVDADSCLACRSFAGMVDGTGGGTWLRCRARRYRSNFAG